MIRQSVKRSVVLVIADPKNPNVKVLNSCIDSLRDGTRFHLGNDFNSLKDAAKVRSNIVDPQIEYHRFDDPHIEY